MKVEKIGVNIFVTQNGVEQDPIPSSQTRFSFNDLDESVMIQDEIRVGNYYISKANEVEDESDTVISDTSTYATDREAVKLYLAEIIGS